MKIFVSPSNYSLNVASKTVTFSGQVPTSQTLILGVLNVTRGVIYYLPEGGAALTGTWSSPVLTFVASTTGHTNGDVLRVVVDDGATGVSVSGPALGNPTDAQASDDTGTWGIISLLKRLAGRVTTLISQNGASATGSISALDGEVALTLSGQSGAFITVGGTFVGTVNFECSIDNGSSWLAVSGTAFGQAGNNSVASSITVTGNRVFNVSNLTNIRVRGNPWTSGIANIAIRASHGFGLLTIVGNGSYIVNGVAARAAAISATLFAAAVRANTSAPTVVTNGQATEVQSDTYGRPVVRPWSIPELAWSYAAASGGIVNTADVTLASAAGAGLRRYLCSCTISNASAVGTELVVKDGASTVLKRYQILPHMPNTLFTYALPPSTAANQTLVVACSTAGAAVFFNAEGFTSP